MKINFISRSSLDEIKIKELESRGDFGHYDNNVEGRNEDDVIKRIDGADIILVNHVTPITKNVLQNSPNLKLIISSTIGTDHIDLQACKEIGVRVRWFPGYCAQTLAEHNFTLILMGLNKIPQAIDNVKKGKWDYMNFCGRELKGCQLLVLGLGKTGLKVKTLAEAVGMSVTGVNSKTAPQEVSSMIKQADVISLNLSLSDNTQKFLNRDRIFSMRPDVVLVNTARGALIDEEALWQFMSAHPNATAFLDVLIQEPPQAQKIEEGPGNIFITPHIGWHSVESKSYIWDEVFNTVMLALDGEFPNPNQEQGWL